MNWGRALATCQDYKYPQVKPGLTHIGSPSRTSLLILATKELQLVNSLTLRNRPPHFLVGVLAQKPQVLANDPQTDILGSAAFKPVKNDMLGNVKVRLIHCPDNDCYLIKTQESTREAASRTIGIHDSANVSQI